MYFLFQFFQEFISGHLVVISEDLFGVLFLELHSFSVYQRVEENLEAVSFEQISRTNWNLQTFPGCTLNPWYRTWLCPPKQWCSKTFKHLQDVHSTLDIEPVCVHQNSVVEKLANVLRPLFTLLSIHKLLVHTKKCCK